MNFTFRHKLKDVVERGALHFADALKLKYGSYMVGPAEPVINRIRNLYLMEMIIKLPRDAKLIAQCKKDVMEQIAILHNNKSFRSVAVIPDVDSM